MATIKKQNQRYEYLQVYLPINNPVIKHIMSECTRLGLKPQQYIKRVVAERMIKGK